MNKVELLIFGTSTNMLSICHSHIRLPSYIKPEFRCAKYSTDKLFLSDETIPLTYMRLLLHCRRGGLLNMDYHI